MEGSGAFIPNPIYARKDSENIAPGIVIIVLVIIGPIELGNICLK